MSFLAHQMTYMGCIMEKSAMSLRNYRDEDYEQYARMCNAAFAPMRRALGIEPVNCCEDRQTLLAKSERLYVLEEDGVIVGSVGINGGEIDDLIVDENHRSKGIGTKLLRFAIGKMQSDGISPITLHVADWNRGAIELYRKNGFEITKTERIDRGGFYMSGVITIGETMAAFTPGANGPLRYVSSFGIRSAGAESNVAVGLAKLDVPAAWISRVGQDEFGHFLRNAIRAEGVDCSKLIFDAEHRTGVMFKEVSAGGTSVYYYRENSAASHLCPEDLKEEWFAEADIVHLSGITPILSESCKAMIYRAFELAKQYGALVSFDPNIRKKLWKDKDFTPMIREMTLMSDIVLIGLDEAKVLFGTENVETIVETLRTQGSAKYIAIKDGGNGAWVADVKQCVHVPPYPCDPIEPIGAGDGFNAGFLAGLIKGKDLITAGRMGGICGALATQVPGDVEGYPDSLQMEKALAGLETIYR